VTLIFCPLYPLRDRVLYNNWIGRLGGPQGWSGCFWEGKCLLLLPCTETLFLGRFREACDSENTLMWGRWRWKQTGLRQIAVKTHACEWNGCENTYWWGRWRWNHTLVSEVAVKTRFGEADGSEVTRLWVKWLWKHALVRQMAVKSRVCEWSGCENMLWWGRSQWNHTFVSEMTVKTPFCSLRFFRLSYHVVVANYGNSIWRSSFR
jgi:hypothetical protein